MKTLSRSKLAVYKHVNETADHIFKMHLQLKKLGYPYLYQILRRGWPVTLFFDLDDPDPPSTQRWPPTQKK